MLLYLEVLFVTGHGEDGWPAWMLFVARIGIHVYSFRTLGGFGLNKAVGLVVQGLPGCLCVVSKGRRFVGQGEVAHSSVINSFGSNEALGLLCVQNIQIRFGAFQALFFAHTLSTCHGLLLLFLRDASIVCSRVVFGGLFGRLFRGDGLVKVDSG